MGDVRHERIKPEAEGEANLERMFLLADRIDLDEGKQAYARYHLLMREIAQHHCLRFDRVVAAFAALSPNNDYVGNLRSLLTLIKGFKAGVPAKHITVSTYGHCRNRAYNYLAGTDWFPTAARGPKITAFYYNIIDPLDAKYVTIDGHMVATYNGAAGATMKDSIVRKGQYRMIADTCKRLAFRYHLRPCEFQATVWFVRKRILKVKYDPQIDLFAAADGDVWRILRSLSELTLFPIRGL